MRFGKSKPCSGEEEEDSPRERVWNRVGNLHNGKREREREREREEVIRIPLKGHILSQYPSSWSVETK